MTDTMSDERVWLRTVEACALLQHTPETLIKWAKRGRIPSHRFRKLPKEYRFHKEWVEDPVLLP